MEEEDALAQEQPLAFVGIGASAGGIEALRTFFGRMPQHSGLAFIVVLHLAPERSSLLAGILGQWTAMPVAQATDDSPVAADHVYVIPPNAVLTLKDGRLRITEPTGPRHSSAAVDALFASLAAEKGPDTFGIVLSGTGSDGSLGLKAIKGCGGVTMAQGSDGSQPEYGGMPASAIATGAVDLILPVEDMPERIMSIVRGRKEGPAAEEPNGPEQQIGHVRLEICTILHEQLGHDFSRYKQQTFLRRVQRRMQVVGLTASGYVERLRSDKNEVVLLFRDLLIGVTSFFRDGATFEAVETVVLPRLFAGMGTKDVLRIWVPGCATGEEAYSLAMMVVEFMDKVKNPPSVQIFATDIDEPAIAIARVGRYPAILLRDVPPERIARFFKQVDDTYVVTKALRELCTFSAHSVIRDPPFSRMNLISCRNLLIYLDAELQSHVIPAFHYSLVPKGLLLLGGSESVSRHSDLFDSIDRKHRIFERRDTPSPPLQVSALGAARRLSLSGSGPGRDLAGDRSKAVQFAHRRIRDRFSPAFALVTAEGEAVHFSPRTGKYLEIAPGAPTRNLIAQARPGLRMELGNALRRAVETGRSVERHHVSVQFEGGTQTLILTIEPVPDPSGERLFMVVFSDDDRSDLYAESGRELSEPMLRDATVEQLERELRDSHEQNQSVGEEYETALEELKSANEELHSVNEELQSSNEELETSKEEIQSVNEELQTVNIQLSTKIEELDRSSNDLRNVFESTQVATVFLDQNLIVRGFTPAIGGIYNLIPSDIGRPLTDITSSLDYHDLRRDLQRVLATLDPIELRVSRRDTDIHYLMRLLPYRMADNHVEGVLVTFVDVTSMVLAAEHQRLLVDELNHRVKNMLTVVISLAAQTQLGAESLDDFLDAYLGRLRALGATYALLTRDQWTDIPLHDVLTEELSPYMTNNIAMDGPPIFLKPKGALALGMVIHELATNALKYGALSRPEGRVHIRWSIDTTSDGDRFTWNWVEATGPAVSVPQKRGFGLTLIERSLNHELNGTAELTFAPDGLRAVLTVPFDPLVVTHSTANEGALR